MEALVSLAVRVAVASWDVLLDSALYILFGFFVAGLLKGLIPDDFVQRHLGRRGGSSVLKASLFGIPIPLCSCGVIPAAAGLRSQGADKGAVSSFMISTPETGVDSIAVTYALLDPAMTIIRPIAAFFTAMSTGLLVNLLGKDKEMETGAAAYEGDQKGGGCSQGCGCGGHAGTDLGSPGLFSKIAGGMRFAFGELLGDIGSWLLLGIVLAGLISVSLSPLFIATYLGDGLFSMLIMLAVATPLYVCATASTPVAAALALKGLSPGAALVFLLAGPATNMATITVVARLLGKRTAVIYVLSIMSCSLLLGLLINRIYALLGLDVASWLSVGGEESHGAPAVVAAFVLLLLVARSWGTNLFRRFRLKKGCRCSNQHPAH